MILSINTAFGEGQIAVETETETRFQRVEANAKSSENTLPAIAEILSGLDRKIQDVNCFGVVVGPGSFTGVRIGVALVKGFMSVNESAVVVAINSLELMAFEYAKTNNPTSEFHCVQNALSGRFFVAKFSKNGQRLTPDSLVQELPAGLKVGLESESLSEADEFICLTPEILLEFTKLLIRTNQTVDKFGLKPVYIRLSQAEESLYARGIDVVRMEPEHLQAVAEISHAQFGVNGWQLEAFRDELGKAGHFAFVGLRGAEVVGFVFLMETFGDAGKDFNVLNIATKPGEERKGYASRLLKFAEEFAKAEGGARLWLEVRESNATAIEFYEHFGFEKDYVRKHYYSNGENAIIYSIFI